MPVDSHHVVGAAKMKRLDTNCTKCLVTAAGLQHLPGKSNTQGADVPATSGVISCTPDCPWLLGQHFKNKSIYLSDFGPEQSRLDFFGTLMSYLKESGV